MKKNLNKSFRYELIFIILFISSILINFNSSIKEKDSIKSFSVNFHNTDLKINKNQTLGKANKIQWFARIFDDNIYLYKTPNNTVSDNIYFVLQPTYFVELLEEANSTFYKAKYLDIEGYVKKNEVQVVATPPRTPYANNINFRIFNNSSQIMRTIPSASGGNSTQVCFLPLFSQDAQFYGYIEGESAIPQRTNIWYFCKYTLDKTYYGYSANPKKNW